MNSNYFVQNQFFSSYLQWHILCEFSANINAILLHKVEGIQNEGVVET